MSTVTLVSGGQTLTVNTAQSHPSAKVYAAEATLLADTPADGTLAYAQDTDRHYLRQNSAWRLLDYYQQSQFLAASAGAADAGKPIKLDAAGKVHPSMLPIGDVSTARHGAGNSGQTVYYVAGLATNQSLNGGSTHAGQTIHALPFFAPYEQRTIDRLAMRVATGVGGAKIRFGLYTNKSNGDLYPDALVVDSGEFAADTSGTTLEANVNVALTPGKLYWAVSLSTGTPGVVAITADGALNILGFIAPSVTSPVLKIAAAFTYAALPATYPSGASGSTSFAPAIFLRYAP